MGCRADLVAVVLGEHDELRGAVPARDDVLRHVLVLELVAHAREAEVADGQVALAVHEDVVGLEVAVEDVGGVEVLEAAKELVHECLDVHVGEGLWGLDYLGEVGGKEFCDYVYSSEVLVG